MRDSADRWAGRAFRASLATVGLTYLGYPVLALARSALVPRPWRSGLVSGSVSVVVAAHDEAPVIEQKLRSLLASVPAGADVEVIVVDDGSTDGTADVVAAARPEVKLLRLPRCGKAAALEAGVDAARGEILVFTDANSLLQPDSLSALLAPFADPEVGGVAGDQRYDDGSGNAGERAHWSFDRVLKRAESRAGSVVSATGALHAVRRRHFHGVVEGVTDDFWISTGVVADGARLVFAEGAVVTEPAADELVDEHARKVRVMTRGLTGVLLRRELLSPRHGFYAVSLLCRKVLRRLTAVPLVIAAAASVARPGRSLPSAVVAAGTVATVGLGAVGIGAPDHPVSRQPVVAVPAFVCMSVAAALTALRNVCTGTRITRWDQRRTEGP